MSDSDGVVTKGVAIPVLLNNIPHERETRRWFYDDVSASVREAVQNKKKHMKIKIEFPELNTYGDVYRVGTLLEMVREMATALVEDGRRVRVCVQGSMGAGVFQGLPLSLAGVSRLLEMMDWGEEAAPFIGIGGIGESVPQPQDDVFIIIQPQNIVGYSVLPYLQAMEKAAGDRAIILINPKLVDVQSSGDVMSIRGRGERAEYAAGYEEVYHFRLLYRLPYFFPIYGALRKPFGGEWELYKRYGTRQDERYQLMKTYDTTTEPSADEKTKIIWGNKISLDIF